MPIGYGVPSITAATSQALVDQNRKAPVAKCQVCKRFNYNNLTVPYFKSGDGFICQICMAKSVTTPTDSWQNRHEQHLSTNTTAADCPYCQANAQMDDGNKVEDRIFHAHSRILQLEQEKADLIDQQEALIIERDKLREMLRVNVDAKIKGYEERDRTIRIYQTQLTEASDDIEELRIENNHLRKGFAIGTSAFNLVFAMGFIIACIIACFIVPCFVR